MWIPKNVNAVSSNKKPYAAAVQSANSESICTNGSENVPLLMPYGVAGVPPEGTIVLAVPLENNTVIGGVIVKDFSQLQPGELMLYSLGGASIVLKNNGDVIINGTVFEGNSTAEVTNNGYSDQ